MQESPGLSRSANSVPMLSWLDTLEQSLLKAFGAKHFDELGCGTFVQNVNKVISGVVADGRSAVTLPSVSATGPLGTDEVGGKCPSEDAWCQALEAAMATASEVGSVLEGLQQLEGLAHRHLGISSDMGTSLLSQSLKHQQAFALTSPCVAVYVRCTHSRGFWSCTTAVRSEVLLRRRCIILFNVCCMYSRRQVRDVVASYVKRKNRVAHAPAALHQLVRSSCNRPGLGPSARCHLSSAGACSCAAAIAVGLQHIGPTARCTARHC